MTSERRLMIYVYRNETLVCQDGSSVGIHRLPSGIFRVVLRTANSELSAVVLECDDMDAASTCLSHIIVRLRKNGNVVLVD
jgi:hypothetical protein